MRERCENCEYRYQHEYIYHDRVGIWGKLVAMSSVYERCHRYPLAAALPESRWCGEYAPKEQANE